MSLASPLPRPWSRSHGSFAAIGLLGLLACGSIPEGSGPGDPGDDDTSVPVDACVEGARRCEDNTVAECRSAVWTPQQLCPNLCSGGGCVTPPSCGGNAAACGVDGGDTCCHSLPVAAARFSRSYDGVTAGYTDPRYQATVRAFHLDKYEVTAARFDAFVNAYPASRPATGAGRHAADALDPGWKVEWTEALPASNAELRAALLCQGLTSQLPTAPVRCVSWYLAQAFCIWDGARLPTEAEWNAAAAGGEQQRVYPWSVPASSAAIDGSHLVYATTAPATPGSRPPGEGRFGHADLSGNVAEWVFDNHASPYLSDTCVDCANHTAAPFRSLRGGGYLEAAGTVLSSYRSALDPAAFRAFVGFRCAREP
jgi:formylglycine-generating enzyme